MPAHASPSAPILLIVTLWHTHFFHLFCMNFSKMTFFSVQISWFSMFFLLSLPSPFRTLVLFRHRNLDGKRVKSSLLSHRVVHLTRCSFHSFLTHMLYIRFIHSLFSCLLSPSSPLFSLFRQKDSKKRKKSDSETIFLVFHAVTRVLTRYWEGEISPLNAVTLRDIDDRHRPTARKEVSTNRTDANALMLSISWRLHGFKFPLPESENQEIERTRREL